MAVERKEIAWTHNLENALQQARSQQRHVLLDFTAAPM
jgi:thiol:disulfide interchange protein